MRNNHGTNSHPPPWARDLSGEMRALVFAIHRSIEQAAEDRKAQHAGFMAAFKILSRTNAEIRLEQRHQTALLDRMERLAHRQTGLLDAIHQDTRHLSSIARSVRGRGNSRNGGNGKPGKA